VTSKAPRLAKRPRNAGRTPAAVALEKSLSMLKATVESTQDGILVVDKKGQIELSNRKFMEMWRIPAALIEAGSDSLLLDFVVNQLQRPAEFLAKVEELYAHPSAESRDILTFKDGRIFERFSKPQMIHKKYAGRVWSFRDITEAKRAEKISAAVYQISELANRAENLQDLFRSIHTTIGELMPARNFYIALVDAADGTISFPYFVDEFDEAPTPKPPGMGLTEYVLRTGKPLLADPGKTAELERAGEIELIGAPSIDWLGVPLRVRETTIGVMVVQTYREGTRYDNTDKSVLTFVSHQAALGIERKQALDKLREGERFLASIFSGIQDGICVLDTDYTILRVNEAMEKWYSHAMPLVGKKCYEINRHDRTEKCATCPTRRTIETNQAAYGVNPLSGPEGEPRGWLDLYSFPLIDADTGQMRGVIEYLRDITARKEAEESLKASLHEKEVLLKEIHHRVKNNMQVISSLLSLQSRHLQDPTAIAMFRESQHRIRSMALVHEKLYQSQDLSRINFASYLENLLVYLFHAYPVNARGVRLRTDIEDFTLDINTAIPCGLLISELVTNALKHAFPGGGGGEILVAIKPRDGRHYVLTVKDTGVGYPAGLDFRAAETFGMQLVSMLLQQLDGTIAMTAVPGAGTEFRVDFAPLKYPARL
jgi:PAS domain S-box-containing protein